MKRRDFMNSLGLGAAFVLTNTCFQSCTKNVIGASGSLDFSLDLNAAANAALLQNGGYIISNGVVVAKNLSGQYVAATNICSHEQRREVYYNKSNGEWTCSAHGARFDAAGNGLNSEGKKGLTIYQTELTGTTLRIFG